MRCLDHIDLAVITGAATVLASAVFFFAYLGVEREPLMPPAPISAASLLQEELGKAIEEAVVTPALVIERKQTTQVALGHAISRLIQLRHREANFIPELGERAAAARQARREYLEGVFKLPSDWGGAEFTMKARTAEAMAQPELGRMIVAGSQVFARETGAAEMRYGRALVAALGAMGREASEPAASQGTITAAAAAARALAERNAPAPVAEITRDPSWGFGSIGDGAAFAIFALGGGALVLLAAGAGMTTERGASTRTMETHCDVHDQDVVVEMLASDDAPYDVVHCSAFNGGPVTCDKHCLNWPAVARAA